MRRLEILAALVVLTLFVIMAAACESATGDDGAGGGSSGVVESAEQARATLCAPFDDSVPGAPALIAADVDGAEFGACGHLVFVTQDDALHVADPSFAVVEQLGAGVSTGWTRTVGARVAWFVPGDDGAGTLATRDLVTGDEASRPTDHFRAFAIGGGPAGPVFASCEQDGAWLLDGESWQRLDADGEGCREIWAAPHGNRVVLATGEGGLRQARAGALPADDGGTGALAPGVEYVRGTTEDDGAFRNDVLALSPDGHVLAVQTVRDVPCGDTFCSEPEETAHLIDLETGVPIADVEARLAPVGFGAAFGVLSAGTGHRLVFPLHNDTMVLGEDLRLRRFEGLQVLALLGDAPDGGGARALAKQSTGEPFRDLVVLDLETGAVERLGYDPDHLIVSAGGTAAAASVFTSECVRYPERPDTCHTQIWALVVWTADGGVRTVARAHQPVHPKWVGDDGAVLVYGGLYDGAPPESAPADEPDPVWTTSLYGPDGVLRGTWDKQPEQVAPARDGAVLLVVFEDEGSVRRLDAVASTTGAATLLDRGRGLVVQVDPSGTRVAWTARPVDEAEGPHVLTAGAVPLP